MKRLYTVILLFVMAMAVPMEARAECSHNWTYKVVKRNTCTEDGAMEKTCKTCGEVVTITVPAGHAWNSKKVVTKEPTYTEYGEQILTCDVCGITQTEKIEKLRCSHDWDEGKVTRKPTCTKEGVETFTCTICGATDTDSISKLDHTYETSKVLKKAKYENRADGTPVVCEDGSKEETCTVCGKTRTSVINKVGTIYLTNYNDMFWTGKKKTLKFKITDSQGNEIPSSCYKIKYLTDWIESYVLQEAHIVFQDEYEGTYVLRYTVRPREQKITVEPLKTKTFYAKDLKKKAKSFQVKAKAKTKLHYDIIPVNQKYVTVTSKGKVKMKKGTPKGTYELEIIAEMSNHYNYKIKTIYLKVK